MQRAPYTIIGIAALFGTVFVPTDASADWQYTKWGMSKEDVLKASTGAAEESQTNCSGYKPESGEAFFIRSDYGTGGFSFKACLAGGSKAGLRNVTLLLQNSDVKSGVHLWTVLQVKYGTPISDDHFAAGGTTIFTTEWHNGATKIVLMRSTSGQDMNAAVIYTPLVDESTGL